jgi:hypothetical protein
MVSGWLRSRPRVNDESARAGVALAGVQGDSDSEDSWIPAGAGGPADEAAGPAEQYDPGVAYPGWSRARTDLRVFRKGEADDRRATFVREAERRTASIVEATDGRHRVLLANIEASKMGKDQAVGAALAPPEPFTPPRDGEATLDLQDQVGVPSRGLVEAFDDCVASLAWSNPDWIRAGVFEEWPRRRDRARREVAGKIPFYGLILALSGLVGWLIDVTVNAVAK